MGDDDNPDGGLIKDADMESIKKMGETPDGKTLSSSMKYLKKSNADFVKTLEGCQRTVNLLDRCPKSESLHNGALKKLQELMELNQARIEGPSGWLKVKETLETVPGLKKETIESVIQTMEELNNKAEKMEDDIRLALGESECQMEETKIEENRHEHHRGDGGTARLSAWTGMNGLKPTEKMSLSSSTVEYSVFKQKFTA